MLLYWRRRPLLILAFAFLILVVVCPPPSANASTTRQLVANNADCSQYQQFFQFDALQISFTSILDNNVGPNGYLKVRVVKSGKSWVGFSVSPSGHMVPSNAVIGIPGGGGGAAYNPGKYSLTVQALSGVNLVSGTSQTLRDASIIQNTTHTILSFTKRLVENGEKSIHGDGNNTFLVAYGFSNELNYHAFRLAFDVRLKKCVKTTAPIKRTPVRPTITPAKTPTHRTPVKTPVKAPIKKAPVKAPVKTPNRQAAPVKAPVKTPVK